MRARYVGCPVRNAQHRSTQYTAPNTQHPLPSTKRSVLDTDYLLYSTQCRYVLPTKYPQRIAKYPVLAAQYSVYGTQYVICSTS